MEEKNSRKVFLSVLGVAILVVAVVGISFAAYSFTNTDAGDNRITTGTITMSYAEPTSGIELENALPMSDSDARTELTEEKEVFTFTVSATADGTVTIPYEINIEKIATTPQLPDSSVKIELTKGTIGAETVVAAPQTMAELRVAANESTLRAGTYTIAATEIPFVNGAAANATTTYNLRIWVANTVDTTDTEAFPADSSYKVKVHVNSHVNPISEK